MAKRLLTCLSILWVDYWCICMSAGWSFAWCEVHIGLHSVAFILIDFVLSYTWFESISSLEVLHTPPSIHPSAREPLKMQC